MVAVTHSRVVVIRVSRVPNSRGQRQHVNLGFRFFFFACPRCRMRLCRLLVRGAICVRLASFGLGHATK